MQKFGFFKFFDFIHIFALLNADVKVKYELKIKLNN